MATLGEARTVIESDENTLRFEDFCNQIISLMSGRTVTRTARVADLGVDGRAVQLDALPSDLIVAASLRKDAAAKMGEDASRIRETQSGGDVCFCTNAHLSETAKSKARQKVKSLLGNAFMATVLTQEELADLATRFEGPLENLYAVELKDLRERVATIAMQAGGTTQLQIAHALTSPEGFDNRDRVAELLVSEVVVRQ